MNQILQSDVNHHTGSNDRKERAYQDNYRGWHNKDGRTSNSHHIEDDNIYAYLKYTGKSTAARATTVMVAAGETIN